MILQSYAVCLWVFFFHFSWKGKIKFLLQFVKWKQPLSIRYTVVSTEVSISTGNWFYISIWFTTGIKNLHHFFIQTEVILIILLCLVHMCFPTLHVSYRAATRSSCYSRVWLIFPWFYEWNCLFLIQFPHKVNCYGCRDGGYRWLKTLWQPWTLCIFFNNGLVQWIPCVLCAWLELKLLSIDFGFTALN